VERRRFADVYVGARTRRRSTNDPRQSHAPPTPNHRQHQLPLRRAVRHERDRDKRHAEAGQPVTIRELQSSIKNLFATGNFRDVRVDAAPARAGVVLTFSLYLNYRVGEIKLDGVEAATAGSPQRELTVRTGEGPFARRGRRHARAIQEALNRDGYLEATVDPETRSTARAASPTSRCTSLRDRRRSSPASLSKATRKPFEPGTLVQQMKRHSGDTFRLRDARSDAERMKNFLLRRDYRRARVDFIDYKYDAPTHSVALRYRVNTGPKVRVEVAGVPRGDVRRLLPFRGATTNTAKTRSIARPMRSCARIRAADTSTPPSTRRATSRTARG
jgi:outer membrane protein assembly factor BamA